MNPKQKLQMIRQAEVSPGVALLNAVGFLRDELLAVIEAKLAEIEAKLPEKVILAHIEKIKGEKGDSADPVDHEKIIEGLVPVVKSHTEFFVKRHMPVPKDGETPTDERLLSLIRPLIPKVKDGKTPTEKELLVMMQKIMPDIETMKPTDSELRILIRELIPSFEKPKPLTPSEIFNMIETAPMSFTIDASRIRNLPRTQKGKYHAAHGGAGSNIGSWSTPAESVDSSRTAFTVVGGAPTDVVADGTTYFEGQGYTYAANQITFTTPPQFYVRYR